LCIQFIESVGLFCTEKIALMVQPFVSLKQQERQVITKTKNLNSYHHLMSFYHFKTKKRERVSRFLTAHQHN